MVWRMSQQSILRPNVPESRLERSQAQLYFHAHTDYARVSGTTNWAPARSSLPVGDHGDIAAILGHPLSSNHIQSSPIRYISRSSPIISNPVHLTIISNLLPSIDLSGFAAKRSGQGFVGRKEIIVITIVIVAIIVIIHHRRRRHRHRDHPQ